MAPSPGMSRTRHLRAALVIDHQVIGQDLAALDLRADLDHRERTEVEVFLVDEPLLDGSSGLGGQGDEAATPPSRGARGGVAPRPSAMRGAASPVAVGAAEAAVVRRAVARHLRRRRGGGHSGLPADDGGIRRPAAAGTRARPPRPGAAAAPGPALGVAATGSPARPCAAPAARPYVCVAAGSGPPACWSASLNAVSVGQRSSGAPREGARQRLIDAGGNIRDGSARPLVRACRGACPSAARRR